MSTRKTLFAFLAFVLIVTLAVPVALAGSKARKPAIHDAADRVVESQRTDLDWEGTWYWYAGSTYDATNLTGVTALGLLEAYNDTNDTAYLDAAIDAADFIMVHLGSGATGTQHHVRTTAPDIVFLHRLAEVTGDSSYATRADAEWANITSYSYLSTAGDLDALFRAINRPSAWDIAYYLEAAHLSGDSAWADDAAAIVANHSDSFYYDSNNPWYALNLAGAIRALVGSGYGDQYSAEIGAMLDSLIALVDKDDGIGGWVQDTSYAVMAFRTVGGSANKYANDLGRWLAENQQTNGGWLESNGTEYFDRNGEALRALSMTIGSNDTVDQFSYGSGDGLNSSWTRSASSEGFNPYDG